MIPQDHPFRRYMKYYYLDSGSQMMPIFLFRWDEIHGTLIELFLNDKDSGPRGRAYSVKFETDQYWELNKGSRDIIRKTYDELYDSFCHILDAEVLIHGSESREDS